MFIKIACHTLHNRRLARLKHLTSWLTEKNNWEKRKGDVIPNFEPAATERLVTNELR